MSCSGRSAAAELDTSSPWGRARTFAERSLTARWPRDKKDYRVTPQGCTNAILVRRVREVHPKGITFMRKLLLATCGVLALATTTATRADISVRLQMGFPAILPPLVEVQPGVSVVQDFDEEVFFTGGYYWVQRDGNWYRARDHRGTWRYVRPGGLPDALVRLEPGRYRRWQHDEQKAWPDARHARSDARHWRPSDHQERQPSQGEHHQERQDRGNGHNGGP